jgi:hypothetical protein
MSRAAAAAGSMSSSGISLLSLISRHLTCVSHVSTYLTSYRNRWPFILIVFYGHLFIILIQFPLSPIHWSISVDDHNSDGSDDFLALCLRHWGFTWSSRFYWPHSPNTTITVLVPRLLLIARCPCIRRSLPGPAYKLSTQPVNVICLSCLVDLHVTKIVKNIVEFFPAIIFTRFSQN